VFDLGSMYPAALDVFNSSGVLTDPQTVTLTITLPDGTTVSPVVTLPSTVAGQLRYNYQTVQAGRHLVRWVTQNPNVAYTDAFDVAEAAPPMILSLAMAKKQLQIDPANTTDDDEIREMLMGITKAVENYKDEAIAFRQITAESHQFDLWSWSWQVPRMILDWKPVITLTNLTSEDGAVNWLTGGPIAANQVGRELYIDGSTGIITVVRGTPITGWVMASYTVGYQVIPYNYIEGAKVMFQYLWESRRGPGGLSGVVGPEELHAMSGGHPYLIPRKAQEWFGPQFPAVA
jgi:hypothetical protein